jgi:hypothetical protein
MGQFVSDVGFCILPLSFLNSQFKILHSLVVYYTILVANFQTKSQETPKITADYAD